ncbi:hypothetical protein AOQ84DRAFT_367160 [Glonium stellatum]|uniref:Uncharacterized protein n=1 Tax=Glonium stellatum TaxID=574774 RepID=A0A8E2ETX8_9PEZI|nr:hypothetical protein AOQ84DRAFT_367160 [Glonium stellatum]
MEQPTEQLTETEQPAEEQKQYCTSCAQLRLSSQFQGFRTCRISWEEAATGTKSSPFFITVLETAAATTKGQLLGRAAGGALTKVGGLSAVARATALGTVAADTRASVTARDYKADADAAVSRGAGADGADGGQTEEQHSKLHTITVAAITAATRIKNTTTGSGRVSTQWDNLYKSNVYW